MPSSTRTCSAARVIWRKRRGSRIRGAGPGACQDGKPCIFPRSGIASTALAQIGACQPGKTGFIDNTGKLGLPELIGQLQRLGVNVFFGYGEMQDFKNATKQIAIVDQGGSW